jgi:hypothetical protein
MVTCKSGDIGSSLLRRPGSSIRPPRPSAICLVVLLLLSGTFVDFGWGQEGPPSEPPPRNFQIPSQPLASALEAFARESGIEVLYESSIVASLQSTSVEGAYTPEMALQMLLSRTELRVRYARANAITLSLPGDDDSLPPVSPLADADLSLDTLQVTSGDGQGDARYLREFSEIIQSDLEKALRQNARTRSGSYKASVSLWVDSSRKIRTVGLLRSTGNAERDASIPVALQGVVLSRAPPANAPQPVNVVITVRSL